MALTFSPNLNYLFLIELRDRFVYVLCKTKTTIQASHSQLFILVNLKNVEICKKDSKLLRPWLFAPSASVPWCSIWVVWINLEILQHSWEGSNQKDKKRSKVFSCKIPL